MNHGITFASLHEWLYSSVVTTDITYLCRYKYQMDEFRGSQIIQKCKTAMPLSPFRGEGFDIDPYNGAEGLSKEPVAFQIVSVTC